MALIITKESYPLIFVQSIIDLSKIYPNLGAYGVKGTIFTLFLLAEDYGGMQDILDGKPDKIIILDKNYFRVNFLLKHFKVINKDALADFIEESTSAPRT